MNTADFISTELLLSDILSSVNDMELRMGFSKGWYLSKIQRGLEEISLDSFWDKKTLDLKMPKNLRMDIPSDVFNIMYMYGWNGDCCSPTAANKIWWKRNYNNKGGDGKGYTADVMEGQNTTIDPFISSYFPTEAVYFANIQEGKIMFSASCAAYENVRIICNGMGGEIGADPIVPRFFRQAIIDYVRTQYYQAMTAKEPRIYRVLYKDAQQDLNNEVNGSWKKARMRVSSMNTFEAKSLQEYYARMNY